MKYRLNNPICKQCKQAMINLYYHTSKYVPESKWKNKTINVKSKYWICRKCEQITERRNG